MPMTPSPNSPPDLAQSINFVWTLIAGFLVMFMQAGFALVETGMWSCRNGGTTVLVGASSVAQLEDNVGALQRSEFSADELAEIDRYAVDAGIDSTGPASASVNLGESTSTLPAGRCTNHADAPNELSAQYPQS